MIAFGGPRSVRLDTACRCRGTRYVTSTLKLYKGGKLIESKTITHECPCKAQTVGIGRDVFVPG